MVRDDISSCLRYEAFSLFWLTLNGGRSPSPVTSICMVRRNSPNRHKHLNQILYKVQKSVGLINFSIAKL